MNCLTLYRTHVETRPGKLSQYHTGVYFITYAEHNTGVIKVIVLVSHSEDITVSINIPLTTMLVCQPNKIKVLYIMDKTMTTVQYNDFITS